ncbi:MAG: UMP kinase [Fimbriimonas ginsengisoli]|nr:UMP kinase [Fimbriimonas ginsengisoli]
MAARRSWASRGWLSARGARALVSRRPFGRVLIKLSGEALGGQAGSGLDPKVIGHIAREIAAVHLAGVETAVVVGGGNFIRGEVFSEAGGIDRTVADQMGMLSTIMNALALQSAIEVEGVATRVQSAIQVAQVAESFIRRRAIRHLEKGRVVVFAGGTGNPYFTTDTAAVLRALEIEAECLIKATKVDGVYDHDPKKNHAAVRFGTLTYTEAITKRLAVMDQTAFTMCREHNLPVIVLNFNDPGALLRAAKGEEAGTLMGGD